MTEPVLAPDLLRRIVVTLAPNGRDWLADFSDDADVCEAFTSPLIPTAYHLPTPGPEVVSALQAMNPAHVVVLHDDILAANQASGA